MALLHMPHLPVISEWSLTDLMWRVRHDVELYLWTVDYWKWLMSQPRYIPGEKPEQAGHWLAVRICVNEEDLQRVSRLLARQIRRATKRRRITTYSEDWSFLNRRGSWRGYLTPGAVWVGPGESFDCHAFDPS